MSDFTLCLRVAHSCLISKLKIAKRTQVMIIESNILKNVFVDCQWINNIMCMNERKNYKGWKLLDWFKQDMIYILLLLSLMHEPEWAKFCSYKILDNHWHWDKKTLLMCPCWLLWLSSYHLLCMLNVSVHQMGLSDNFLCEIVVINFSKCLKQDLTSIHDSSTAAKDYAFFVLLDLVCFW